TTLYSPVLRSPHLLLSISLSPPQVNHLSDDKSAAVGRSSHKQTLRHQAHGPHSSLAAYSMAAADVKQKRVLPPGLSSSVGSLTHTGTVLSNRAGRGAAPGRNFWLAHPAAPAAPAAPVAPAAPAAHVAPGPGFGGLPAILLNGNALPHNAIAAGANPPGPVPPESCRASLKGP
ncbi:hypothetical protein BC835DRAFT_510829, partial [Cytidiella melzeri]